MLKSLVHGVKAGLRQIPPLLWLHRRLQKRAMCNTVFTGDYAQLHVQLDALQRLVGNDRIPVETREPFLLRWIETLNRTPKSPLPMRNLMILASIPSWVQFLLPMAFVLAGRGCRVDFVWLPHRKLIQADLEDSDLNLAFPAFGIPSHVQIHPCLRLINLSHVAPRRVTSEMQDLARISAQRDACYLLKRETLEEVRDNPEVDATVHFRMQRNLDCLVRLETLLSQRHYDSALIPNGVVLEYGAAYRLARSRGVPCSTMEFGDRKHLIWASQRINCADPDTKLLWEADAPHHLTPERAERIQRVLLRREMPSWNDGEYHWQGQLVSPQEAAALRTQLGLDPGRPVAMLCTNVAHDSAVLGKGQAFPTMAAWIVETIRWFAGRPDWQLVVRCHPAEAVDPPARPVDQLVKESFACLPDNVRVVKATDRINSYALARISQFGLLFTSTLGLEMATRGIPSILAGRTHYAGKGFTHSPQTREEYFETLQHATTGEGLPRLTERQIELALCYAEIFFLQMPRPFPWYAPGVVEHDERQWPVERILREECPPEYLRTFDLLAGRPTA